MKEFILILEIQLFKNIVFFFIPNKQFFFLKSTGVELEISCKIEEFDTSYKYFGIILQETFF